MLHRARSFLEGQQDVYLKQLIDWVSIPSISTIPEYKSDLIRSAIYIADHLREIGLENVELIETKGNPLVYADWLHAPGKLTVLIYGHYDVQPIDPIEEWISPPFQPEVREGYLYGRGVTDNKGQAFIQIKALETVLSLTERLPVNVKVCLEGEEEIGSRSLLSFLEKDQEKLAADLVLVSDTAMLGENRPAVCYGLRGLVGFEIQVQGPHTDLHSGSIYGGGVQNPIHALIQILSSMRNDQGKITIDGFYEDVIEVSDIEKVQLRTLPFNDDQLKKQIGVSELFGEVGYSTLERVWTRPTLEVNGITGGYQGEGSKTIIPSQASAKVTCRLVPDQDPDQIQSLITNHIKHHIPTGVRVSVQFEKAAYPYVIDIHHPLVQLAVQSYEKVFDVKTSLIRAGGSIPVVEKFSRTLDCPILLMGFSYPESNVHAPNENFALANFEKGILTLCQFWFGLEQMLKEEKQHDWKGVKPQ